MKMHLTNLSAKADDYNGSPHIVNAIRKGSFTECRRIANGFTTVDANLVTCQACCSKKFVTQLV
jgi:hypothetical protein